MEGDAGASRRLNLTDADDSSLSEVTPEESLDSAGGADQTSTEVTPEESLDSEGGADASGTGLPPDSAGSRLGRGWLVAVTVVLVLLAGGVGFGGYLALRSYRESQTIARNDAAALKAAEDCVAATQAPDTAAMADATRRIIECSTGDFGAQAALYSGMLTEAYQAANVHVQVSDMRAAVERNNKDGSIDVLVALRTSVSNVEAQNQEQGYRLRVTMSPAEGQYKISKLDQVAK